MPVAFRGIVAPLSLPNDFFMPFTDCVVHFLVPACVDCVNVLKDLAYAIRRVIAIIGLD